MKRAPLIRTTLAAVLCGLSLGWAVAAPGAHGPDGEHLDAPGASVGASGLARLPDGSVNIPKASQRRMNVRTEMSVLRPVAATLELPAVIVTDPNAGGRVQTLHGGRVEAAERGLAVVGQRVRRGDVLGYVRFEGDPYAHSAQRVQAADLRARRQLAEQRAVRLAALEGSVARKDIEAAQTEARALAEQERSQALALGAREALRAPVSGVVARADVVMGQVVEPREVLFEIVDPARLLVEAHVADPSLPARVGAATLKESAAAQLTWVGAGAVLREGRLPLRFAVRSAQPLPLAVGQPVSLMVQLKEQVQGVVLPARAVVRNPANEPVVWIRAGAHRFIAQPVQFQRLDAERVVITQGLGVDNRVVVDGATLIAQIR